MQLYVPTDGTLQQREIYLGQLGFCRCFDCCMLNLVLLDLKTNTYRYG